MFQYIFYRTRYRRGLLQGRRFSVLHFWTSTTTTLLNWGVHWTPEKLWNKINIKTYVCSNKLVHFHIIFFLFFSRIIETLGPIKNSILSIWLFLLRSVREVLDSSDKINANAHLIKEHFSETTNDVSWCRCRQSNLHVFGIFSLFFTLRFLHAKKYLQSSLVCWWDRFRWCWGIQWYYTYTKYLVEITHFDKHETLNMSYSAKKERNKRAKLPVWWWKGKSSWKIDWFGGRNYTTTPFFAYFEWKTIIRGTNSLSSLDRRWDSEALGSPRGVNGSWMWCDAGMVGEWQEQILWGQFKPRQLSY